MTLPFPPQIYLNLLPKLLPQSQETRPFSPEDQEERGASLQQSW